MPDGQQPSGTSPATRALIIVLALPVILVIMFVVVGRVHGSQQSTLLDGHYKGLKWAEARASSAGFDNIKSHDALGRDRGQRQPKDWQVCFQQPAPGEYAHRSQVEYGVVRLDENCPSTDQGRIDAAGAVMPNLFGRTGYMASVAFGDDASVRYVDVVNEEEISRSLGDYRICAQQPAAGQPWDGLPVKLAVVPYNDNCSHPGKSKQPVNVTAILDRVLNTID